MSPGLGPAELLRNCLLDWAPSGANKKRPPGLGPGSFPKKLQWGPVFLCQIEYGDGTISNKYYLLYHLCATHIYIISLYFIFAQELYLTHVLSN